MTKAIEQAEPLKYDDIVDGILRLKIVVARRAELERESARAIARISRLKENVKRKRTAGTSRRRRSRLRLVKPHRPSNSA